MYARYILLGLVLSLLFLALPAAAVKPLCTDFQDGDGASFNSMMYDPQFGWEAGVTNYNPFTAGLGIHCANDWHYADVDGDGTVEVYLLTGETFTTWFNAEINGVDTFNGPIPVHNFDIIAMDRSWNNGASYGCVDNPENPTAQYREFCNKENLSAFVEKTYGSPQREIKTPPIFAFTGDVIIDSFKGVKQWFAYGWTDLTPRYEDIETGVEKPYMVLNCGTDEDCNTGKCIKPTFDPVDNFCENGPFSRGLGYENFYLPNKEPSKGTDNVLPAGEKEICRFVRPIANGSGIGKAELREIIVTGFDRDSERNKTIEAKVYSNNNGKPGYLLGKVDKDIIDAGGGSVREEILKLPEPVIMGEGALWVCLKYPYSLSEGYLSYFNEGGFDMFVYTPERNDVNRFETERSYIKVKIDGVIDKKEYGDIIREFTLPTDDFVYDSTTDNTLFKGKDLCKPMGTTERAYITEIRGAGFDKGDYIGRKQLLKAVVREDSNGSPGGVLGEAYGEFSVTGTVHEEAVKFENPVEVGGKFWACLNTPDSGTNFIAFNYHGTEAGRDTIYNSMDGTISIAHRGRSYAIRAKAAIYEVAAQPLSYPFSQAGGESEEGSERGEGADVALTISAISLLGAAGAALAFKPRMRGLGTKLSELKARIRPIFPTEKDSITPYVDNNAVRRRIAGRYLSGFGNAAAADKIANWLPGGHYWKVKKQHGEQYALELEKQNEERLRRERELLLKDYIVGSTAPSLDKNSVLNGKNESLGDRLVAEFKTLKPGSFKSILFNGQVYYLEKTASGEELFYNVANQTTIQSIVNANKTKLEKLILTLPFGRPIIVGKEIFQIVDFQETFWGVSNGAVRIYRGNYGDVNLELREFPDGTLMLERDYVDPRPEKAGNALELLKNWIGHLFYDVLKVQNTEGQNPDLSKLIEGLPDLPLAEGPNRTLLNVVYNAVKDAIIDLKLMVMKSGELLGKLKFGYKGIAEFIDNIKSIASGKKNMLEGFGDFSKNMLLEYKLGKKVEAIFKAVFKTGLTAKNIIVGALKAGPQIAALETLKWGAEVFGRGTRIQRFMEANPSLMEDFDRLMNLSLNRESLEKQVEKLEKLASEPNSTAEVKRYLKQIKRVRDEAGAAEEQVVGLYNENREMLEGIEEFLKERQEGGDWGAFGVGYWANVLAGGKPEREYKFYKRKLDDIKIFVRKTERSSAAEVPHRVVTLDAGRGVIDSLISFFDSIMKIRRENPKGAGRDDELDWGKTFVIFSAMIFGILLLILPSTGNFTSPTAPTETSTTTSTTVSTDVKIVEPANRPYTVSGTVKDSEEHPMKGLKIETYSGGKLYKTTYTAADGRYIIETNGSSAIKVSLIYSHDGKTDTINIFDVKSQNKGGNGQYITFSAQQMLNFVADKEPYSKSANVTERYNKKDFRFGVAEGGDVYHALQMSYDYWESKGGAGVKIDAVLINMGGVWNAQHDWYKPYGEEAKHGIFFDGDKESIFQRHGIPEHEYGHAVSSNWGLPKCHIGQPHCYLSPVHDPLDEAFAQFASVAVRCEHGLPECTVREVTGGGKYDLRTVRNDIGGHPETEMALAGVMWELEQASPGIVFDVLSENRMFGKWEGKIFNAETMFDAFSNAMDSTVACNAFRNHGFGKVCN